MFKHKNSRKISMGRYVSIPQLQQLPQITDVSASVLFLIMTELYTDRDMCHQMHVVAFRTVTLGHSPLFCHFRVGTQAKKSSFILTHTFHRSWEFSPSQKARRKKQHGRMCVLPSEETLDYIPLDKGQLLAKSKCRGGQTVYSAVYPKEPQTEQLAVLTQELNALKFS